MAGHECHFPFHEARHHVDRLQRGWPAELPRSSPYWENETRSRRFARVDGTDAFLAEFGEGDACPRYRPKVQYQRNRDLSILFNDLSLDRAK